jgi:hypothetical protein
MVRFSASPSPAGGGVGALAALPAASLCPRPAPPRCGLRTFRPPTLPLRDRSPPDCRAPPARGRLRVLVAPPPTGAGSRSCRAGSASLRNAHGMCDRLSATQRARSVTQVCSRVVGKRRCLRGLIRARVCKAATSKADSRRRQDWFLSVCRVGALFLSRPVGWRRFAALATETVTTLAVRTAQETETLLGRALRGYTPWMRRAVG